MKIWKGFGSEHSYNLVMIGRFKEIRKAQKAKALIDQLIIQMGEESNADLYDVNPEDRRYSGATSKILRDSEIYGIGPIELRQLVYDVSVRIEGNDIVMKTDEIDISAFIKILIEKGARVEVYSAHEYPDSK